MKRTFQPKRLLRAKLAALLAAAALSGCVLSPQTIELNQSVALSPGQSPNRDALVRVVDQRSKSPDWIGHRGGRAPENSPLLVSESLDTLLTRRLQDSLRQLGFGQGPEPALKVQMDIDTFMYQCNEGVIVNQCGLEIELMVTVIKEQGRFSKPYRIRQSRELAVSPVQEYNQTWVNEALDSLWQHMFSDSELRRALGV
ncbi:YajG family lipoprotein [Bacterioplanes sanyensis]|nr:YajG family lipoprotein [Bacterioplanes sanyensis]